MTLKELTEDYQHFVAQCFVFSCQNLVYYVLPDKRRSPLRKQHLIYAIDFFLSRLALLGHKDDIKQGFVLERFKYYELSTYLYGIVNYYSSLIGLPLHSMNISRFSHLPDNVMKPEKETLVIEVASVKDPEGPLCYCCVIGYIPLCSLSIEGLRKSLLVRFPHWKSKYNILLDVK